MTNKYLANKLVSLIIAVSIWSLILWYCIGFGGLSGLIFVPIFAIWAPIPCYVIYDTVKKLENKIAILTAIILNVIINGFGLTAYYSGIIHPDALTAVLFITVPAFQLILVFFAVAVIKHIENKYK